MAETAPDKQVVEQAQDQTGSLQVRVRLDQQKMNTAYANAFRSNATAEEVILDFGMNLVVPSGQGQAPPAEPPQVVDMLFEVNQRVVLNYYTAKRLGLMLAQLVRAHEQRFGELKLNAAARARKT